MKKNKALSSPVLGYLFLICAFTILSCEHPESNLSKATVFYDALSEKSFGLENPRELNELAKVLAKESGEIKILKNAAVITMTDSKGVYRAISVRYQVGDVTTSLLVPISEASPAKLKTKTGKLPENVVYYVAEPCEMKCTADNCDICTQQVIERCKSQSCTCEGLSSGCNPSISFPQ